MMLDFVRQKTSHWRLPMRTINYRPDTQGLINDLLEIARHDDRIEHQTSAFHELMSIAGGFGDNRLWTNVRSIVMHHVNSEHKIHPSVFGHLTSMSNPFESWRDWAKQELIKAIRTEHG